MTPEFEKECERMREASGRVKSRDPLITFLYLILRDHVSPGELETMSPLKHGAREPLETVFTNGWLASYAEDIAARLREVPDYSEEINLTIQTLDPADRSILFTTEDVLRRRIANRDRVILDLRKELSSLKNRIALVEDLHEHAKELCQGRLDQIKKLEKQIENQSDVIEDYRKRVVSQDVEMDGFRTMNSIMCHENNALKKKIRETEEEPTR